MRRLVAAMILLVAGSVHAADVRDSVCKIFTTQRMPDFVRPWTKGTPREITGSGVVIKGNRILTNAHVVLYGQRIFVQPHQSSDRIRAKVIGIAPEMDLAVLTADDSFFKDRPSLDLADSLPKTKDTVNAYGYPVGGQQMSVTEGIVSRIEYAGYNYSAAGLRIQVDAAVNSGNSGGPAIADGKIVGLVFSRIGRADNIGYIIPAEEIREFLKDIKDKKFDGKPRIVATLQTVENAALRSRLKLPSTSGGIMVKETMPDLDSKSLKKFDVITHVGDYALDRRGNVQLEDGLQLSFQYVVSKLTKDDKAPVTVFRDGKSIKLNVPVFRTRDFLIPWLKGDYPRHFVVGPMTFMTATQDLVVGLGATGDRVLRAKQNPLVLNRNRIKSSPDEEMVVLGARLFSHPISQGYSPQTFGVVSHINETRVKNLKHLVQLIRDAKGEYIAIDVAGSYETLIFKRQPMLDSTDEILEDEGIRSQYSPDLGKVWNKED